MPIIKTYRTCSFGILRVLHQRIICCFAVVKFDLQILIVLHRNNDCLWLFDTVYLFIKPTISEHVMKTMVYKQ